VAAVVLAAGSSTRMGQNKLLLDLGGETVVRRAVRAAIEAGLHPVVVVLGHEADRVGAELEGLPCRTVVNPRHAEGAATSLGAGVAVVPEGAAALVVILADMPFVTAAMLRTMAERHHATGAPVVVSRYGDVEAPPTLFDRRVFPELTAMDGDRCAQPVARRHRAEGAFVIWPAEALQDLDVAADYEQVRARRSEG
jgi:molybdenum cofactor cytidylyltransferase